MAVFKDTFGSGRNSIDIEIVPENDFRAEMTIDNFHGESVIVFSMSNVHLEIIKEKIIEYQKELLDKAKQT